MTTNTLSSSLRREFADVERQLEEASRMSDSVHSAEYSYRGASLVRLSAKTPERASNNNNNDDTNGSEKHEHTPVNASPEKSRSSPHESNNGERNSQQHMDESRSHRRDSSRSAGKKGNSANQSRHNNANNNSTHSMSIARRQNSTHNLKLDPHDLTFCRYRKRLSIACDDELFMREANMNHIRLSIGLYKGYPLAQAMLNGATIRERILKEHGVKQTDHIKGTDGWMKSMCAWEPRALDNIMVPWTLVTANAFITTLIHKVGGVSFDNESWSHWDTVYSLVLKTSLAFLLVFRLNRCAMRYWETRTMWGNVTRVSRSLISAILTHCGHHIPYRDNAIRWSGAYCVACMRFIRREASSFPTAELAGFLKRSELDVLEHADHAPLFVASQIRYYLRKALKVDASISIAEAHARTIHMNYMENLIDKLIEQISAMERIRSTPLPVVYTSHLRTFLFVYMLFLPYIWVREWGWATFFLVGFTAFALFGIEGASSEVEIPFDKHRPNHLALDAYCCTILDNAQTLVIHEANLDMQEQQGHDDDHEMTEGDDNQSMELADILIPT